MDTVWSKRLPDAGGGGGRRATAEARQPAQVFAVQADAEPAARLSRLGLQGAAAQGRPPPLRLGRRRLPHLRIAARP